ncbi:MAG TPA: hypothetical protein VGR51_05380 [Thermoplasmata archaeon]|jgi:hypothetical protein|nr:hypothetical protein [Thermoplasmata archaeon]
MAGERDVLAKALRARAAVIPERFDDTSVWTLRSDLFALDAYLRAHPKEAPEKVRVALDRAKDLAASAHAFTSELRGFTKAKDRTEAASLFELGSIGVLSIENILTADPITLPRILMGSLSETLTFLASRQIVAGSRDMLEGVYRQHAAAMYEEMWTLATDHRKALTGEDVKAVQAGIDGFFSTLEAASVEARVAVLRQFYALLLMLRSAELLEALGG